MAPKYITHEGELYVRFPANSKELNDLAKAATMRRIYKFLSDPSLESRRFAPSLRNIAFITGFSHTEVARVFKELGINTDD